MKKLRRLYHKARSKFTLARAKTEHEMHLWVTTKDRTHLRRWRRWRRKEKYLKRLTKRRGKALRRSRLSHREGVDFAFGRPSGEAMHASGKTFVARYLTPTDSMCLSKSEARYWKEHNIDIVMVWEYQNDAALEGRDQGRRDAYRAKHLAHVAGAGPDDPIYFAVDFETSGERVAEYFKGVAEVLPAHRIGGYAQLSVIAYLFDHDLITYGWQTYAWSHHAWDHRAHLKQTLINLPNAPVHVGGVFVDLDKTTAIDFGQWR